MRPSIQALIIGIVAPLTGSIVASIGGVGIALGLPLSDVNLRYAIESVCGWGIIGSVLLTCCLLPIPPQRRVAFALVGSIVWSILAGGYAFLYAAAIASC